MASRFGIAITTFGRVPSWVTRLPVQSGDSYIRRRVDKTFRKSFCAKPCVGGCSPTHTHTHTQCCCVSNCKHSRGTSACGLGVLDVGCLANRPNVVFLIGLRRVGRLARLVTYGIRPNVICVVLGAWEVGPIGNIWKLSKRGLRCFRTLCCGAWDVGGPHGVR